MSNQKWSDDQFGSRVKRGRESRKWSQVEMAKMLCNSGIDPMHATTLAKIEGGTRSVRINEALGIADLFGVSLDVLMGRSGEPTDADHLAFTLRLLRDAARTASDRTFDDAWEIERYVRQIDSDFELNAADELRAQAATACNDLRAAYDSASELASLIDGLVKTTVPVARRPRRPAKVGRL